MTSPPPTLRTNRLVLRIPEPAEAALVLSYFVGNREHLAPWDPPTPADFYTESYWRQRLQLNLEEQAADRSLRLCLFLADHAAGGEMIGTCNLSNVVRGAFQACHLGYGIDHRHEGRGLMSEAVGAVATHAFETMKLHRVMANYVPTNDRSARLLEGLGFVREGLAADYLHIAGQWRDHVLTALVNPDPGVGRSSPA